MREYWRVVAAGNIVMPTKVYSGWHTAENARMRVVRAIQRREDRDIVFRNTAVYCYASRQAAIDGTIHDEIGKRGREM